MILEPSPPRLELESRSPAQAVRKQIGVHRRALEGLQPRRVDSRGDAAGEGTTGSNGGRRRRQRQWCGNVEEVGSSLGIDSPRPSADVLRTHWPESK